jgi:solute carrier family 25 (mitochondrial citrate transporter), member 1
VFKRVWFAHGGCDLPPPSQKKIVAERGFLGLYRGLSSLLIGTVPKTSLRFGVFGKIKDVFKDEKGSMTPARTLLAGMATGLVEATMVVTPVETMKTLLISDQNSAKPRFRGLFHGARTIVAEQGLAGIYKGWTPTAAKQMGNQGIRFTSYEAIKDMLRTDGKPLHPTSLMLAGGGAGFISVILTMPFDVVKTRMQGVDAAKYAGTGDCVKRILADEGVLAFWKGMAARLPRVVFGQSITLAGYDVFMRLFNKMF